MKYFRAVLVVAAIGAAACQSLSLAGEKVRTTDRESDVTACRALGTVTSSPPWVGPKDAQHDLQNQTAKLGGDVVLVSYGIGTATGKAYDCGGKYSK